MRLLCLQVPRERFCLGLLPTPVHRFAPPGLPEGIEMWIKRDDLTGMQLSGNKVDAGGLSMCRFVPQRLCRRRCSLAASSVMECLLQPSKSPPPVTTCRGFCVVQPNERSTVPDL